MTTENKGYTTSTLYAGQEPYLLTKARVSPINQTTFLQQEKSEIIIRGYDMSKSVIFFKSKSCPHCKHVEPILNEVIELYKDSVVAITVDITEDIQLAVEKGVMSVPTIIFLKDNQEGKRLTGILSKDKIVQAINNL